VPRRGPKRGPKSAQFRGRARAGNPGVFFPRIRAQQKSAVFHFSWKPAVATLKKTFFWFSCFSQLPQDSPENGRKQRKPATNGGRKVRQKTENPRFPPRALFFKPGKAQRPIFANRVLQRFCVPPVCRKVLSSGKIDFYPHIRGFSGRWPRFFFAKTLRK